MMLHSASTIAWYSDGLVMRISALSFSALSSSSTLSSSTGGSTKLLRCCSKPAYENDFLKATPLTSCESCSAPPCTFLMPIMFMGMSTESESTASTTILAKNCLCPETSFEESDVAACLSSIRRIVESPATGTCSTSILATASAQAWRKARTIVCACTPSSTKGLASRSNSPASTTTEVVPSPTSASCERAMSTSVLAAGWTMSRSFMSVAPSLEIVTTPSRRISLSIPRGPSVVRRMSTTALIALMLEMSCALPCDESVPSRSSRIVGCIM
mmetsp:Transcript_31008/g.77568  ORF Transcript_31008/g.77568 Transcript_31008/m.77568 type:complete len:272 (-) Transcript_31008:65-880(-)